MGHHISDKGIQPLPEKLDTIRNMPRPRTPKEIKQFLGLRGYYQKFVPHFSEISRPLAKLTEKDTSFEWTPQCQFSFEMLKDALMSAPILKYPNDRLGFTVYQTYVVRGLNVVSERLFIQPMLWGNWLYV